MPSNTPLAPLSGHLPSPLACIFFSAFAAALLQPWMVMSHRGTDLRWWNWATPRACRPCRTGALRQTGHDGRRKKEPKEKKKGLHAASHARNSFSITSFPPHRRQTASRDPLALVATWDAISAVYTGESSGSGRPTTQ
ncbi:hypothetical protein CI102_6953 [Trichoderma harzianum]|uniref:Uncharacterized protein n=1 Tax=Trichoderma harzianum CBS 226.95 TaxID=983964 RepID=A0A2T4AJS3_TRIHA|nr:hypothetical protein M431DRAFT_337375 [Trichoderma harzianum CBS 226.95]PKK50440.1 hypothetical protein CI102_6953 [Trichoderma harzianum]PTB57313.1 hypothetical protein M431DRAFT_337375 [Trichoderma harzianum CBS 226.95]